MKSATILSLLSATAALAMPALNPVSALQVRQEEELWKNPDGSGNIAVSVGDGKLDFGHVVPSSTLDKVLNDCTMSACKPNEPYKVETRLVTVEGIMGIMTNVELTVEAQFAPDGNEGDKKQLVDIAKSIMQGLYQEGIAERKEGVPYRTKPCQQTPTQGCRPVGDMEYTDQWRSTDHINVQVTHEIDGKVVIAGFLNVAFSLSEGATDSGVCGAVMSHGAAIAGVINSAAGTGMSLLSVFCLWA